MDVKFRLAQSYDRSGDYEAAVKLYEELLKKDSANFVLFDALHRDYLQLKRYDDAIVLLQKRLTTNPKDIGLLTQLGTAYIRKPDEPKALEAWEQAIATDPKREMTYRIVAGAMIENRLFDRAVVLYKRGRSACGDPAMFTNDLAYLYSIMLNYPEATREYLNLLRQNPAQLSTVQLQMARYTGRAEGLSAAILVVEQAAKSDEKNLPLRQLLAWLYMEGKRFDQAFTLYKEIDKMMNAGGHELYNFAERALREKAYSVASKTFVEVQNNYPKFDLMAQVKFGYARSLEESAMETDTLRLFGNVSPFSGNDHPETESSPIYTGALAAYNHVVTEYPKTEFAARSLYRIAVLKDERLFDLDGARTALQTIEQEYPTFAAIRNEASLLLGDVHVGLSQLDVAETKFKFLVSQNSLAGEPKEKAQLRLAELDYYRGNFQDALNKLQELTKNAVSDITNDGLSLQIFIQENLQSNEKPLKEFAAADLLKKQRKLSEALARFESLLQSYPKTDIVDETLMNIGDLLTQMKRFPEAVTSFERLIKEFPESLTLDRALMKIAQIYELGMNEKAKAIDTYQKLLTEHPNSIYVSEARKRIRELRGDTI
jgi:tetratricopeptide (TPR) repeat protein